MKISIIVPTYNRSAVLRKALDGYCRQSAPDVLHEIIIVDDGSTDDTRDVVRAFESRLPIRYHYQQNRGPAVARNTGIRLATGSIVLFTDDDVIPSLDLLAEHARFHREHPRDGDAVLGYVTWSPDIPVTPFMRWYGEYGALFGFALLEDNTPIEYRFLYTCNVSFKASLLRASGGFREDFKRAAYEDIELGYRLHHMGMWLFFCRSALAYHYQSFSFEEACRRSARVREGRAVFVTTEAGKAALKRSRLLRLHTASRLAAFVVRCAAPLRPMLDSGLRLPNIVYRLFYWYYGTHVPQ